MLDRKSDERAQCEWRFVALFKIPYGSQVGLHSNRNLVSLQKV